MTNANTITIYEERTLAPSLKKITMKIGTLVDKINENYFKVAQYLYKIKNEKMYADDFKTYEEYCKEVFNISKAQGYNLATIGGRFSVEGNSKSCFADVDGNDFKPSQLAVLIRVPNEAINEWISSGSIGYDTTVLELKKKVAEYKKAETDTTETDTTETVTAETDTAETDTAEKSTLGFNERSETEYMVYNLLKTIDMNAVRPEFREIFTMIIDKF